MGLRTALGLKLKPQPTVVTAPTPEPTPPKPTDPTKRVATALSELGSALDGYKKKNDGANCPLIYAGSPVPPVPPQELLEGCTVLTDRYEILRRLPKGGRFAEVGTLYGGFAVQIATIIQPEELHLFDLRFDLVSDENRNRLPSNTVFHQGDSSTGLKALGEAFFDITYVDADHSYAAVYKDLEAAYYVTKPGGFIICNDYTLWSFPQGRPYGVFAAVNEFAIAKGLKFCYLALQCHGFYDVALRR